MLDAGPEFEEYNLTEDCREQLRRLAEYGSQPLALPTSLIIVCCIPMAIIILLTVFGNLLVLFFKARVGRTNTTLLVWNLGLTDFLVGIIVLPLGAFHLAYRKWIFGRFLCRVWVAADVTFCTCSVVTICVISVDRYLAVTRPLRYKSLVTKTKVIIVMITIWVFSSSILLTTVRWEQPPCYDDSICFAGNEIRYLAHSVVFAFFLPASVTLTLYWRIYKLARNRQRALDRGFLMVLGHNMNFLSNTISQQSSNTLRVHFGKNCGMVEHQRRVLRTHERIAKTLGVVSCSFLFCWLPFFSLYLTNYKCQGCISPIAIDLASWLGYCNSMLNPIIYSFTVKEFKKSALRLIAPAWRFAHICLPKILPAPPDHIMQRMSRTHRRVRNKTRHRSFDTSDEKNSKFNYAKCGHKRRQTEPAVFGLQKKICDATAAPIIDEEDEDAQPDYSESNGFTTFNETSRRLSDHPPFLTPSSAMLPIIEMDSSNVLASNGECKSDNSACRIKVFCDTTEAAL
ncbi:SERotonin/octopamine receptor family [Trichostrongylus colubriformis]|uniref:SERotonin/octopamine receptor family n=1 Tax=Trichostrongylus colubriformis TaxID=6319 RepID=A0AAN8IBD2_TRICO